MSCHGSSSGSKVRQFCPKENGEFSQENPGKWWSSPRKMMISEKFIKEHGRFKKTI